MENCDSLGGPEKALSLEVKPQGGVYINARGARRRYIVTLLTPFCRLGN